MSHRAVSARMAEARACVLRRPAFTSKTVPYIAAAERIRSGVLQAGRELTQLTRRGMRTRATRACLVLLVTGPGMCGPGLAWRAPGLAIEYPAAHADITYVYDALGRLVGVVDPAGDTGIYQYDAVGNLTGIARYASSTVGIIAVAPGSGSVGTGVTISGTGFSPTPSQNTVTFNGTSVTVTASTATQIVTTVPAGATTGLIAVTAPAGSATSPTAFTVTGPGAPTITSFTPSVGPPGTAVTISGTNFEPVPTRNLLNFHHARAAVGWRAPPRLG